MARIENLPLVTVIIRTKNRPALLAEALQSVAAQTYPNIEIIVVNDGGEDVSEIIRPFDTDGAAIVPLQFSESAGRSKAANAGLEKATGEYIAFLDDDDWLEPEHIQLLLELLESQPHDDCIAAYSGVRCIDQETGASIKLFNQPYNPAALKLENYIPIHAVLFRRSAIEGPAACRFDEAFDLFEDWDFWLQLQACGKFVWNERITANYRVAAAWVVSPTRSALEQVALGLEVAPVPAAWQPVYHARPMLNRYSREEARRRLGWRDDVLYVLGVGRIAPVKQFPMLIEACARLKQQADVQLVILGEGECDSLLAMGRQLKLARDILFASTDDVGLYLYAADLYVSASASESFGLANLEAMAAGLAVVCTAVGGVPEVVGDGALLVPPEAEALAGAMQRLLDNEALRQAIAQKGLARAKAWPDIVEIANSYEKIYR